MPASPAVILANIPAFLRTNGKVTATHVLGSKTGVEVGACYWKLHPTQPRFMVVFKNKVDRDTWYNTSVKLKEMKTKGVLVSTAWYSRDEDEVISEEVGQSLDSGGRGKKGGGGNYMKLLQERDRNARGQNGRDSPVRPVKPGKLSSPVHDYKTTNLSVDNMNALSAEIEDLSKLDTSQFLFAQKNKLEKLVNSPLLSSRQPSVVNPKAKVFTPKAAHPPVSAPGYNLRSSQVVKTDPVFVMNISQDFSVPPPPLRLPLHVKPVEALEAASVGKEDCHKTEYNSNILVKLEESVLESLEDEKENKIDENLKHVAKAVANSWKAKVEFLEKTYEAVLSEASPNISKLSEVLDKEYLWEGELGVSREQALGWTKEFLAKAGMRAGSDMEERFARFLLKNGSQFKISIDEIKFIMQRNGLDINNICKAYSENSSSVGFRNFVKTSVSISGNLLDDFAGVFLQFFKSKMDEQNMKSLRQTKQIVKPSADLGTKMNAKGDSNVKVDVQVDKLSKLLAKNDVKGIKHLVNEIVPKMKKLVGQNEALEEKVNDLIKAKNKLETEVKLTKEDCHEKIRTANQENKMLRARNTSLQDDLRISKEEEDESKARSDELTNFVNKFSEAVSKGDTAVELLLKASTKKKDDKEVCKLKETLGAIFTLKNADKKTVKLITSEDIASKDFRRLVVAINEENLVDLIEVEKVVGKTVCGMKFKQGKSKGWKNLKVEKGLISPPVTGWGDLEYLVITQDEEAPGHLGQGCISTPGHARRQESIVREGPMFPPHLGGPRISTE